MKTPPDNKPATPPSAPKSHGLRLVKSSEEPAKSETAQKEPLPSSRPRSTNNFVQFMNAYADAIDRDVKLILDL